ncbi:isoprenoid biosynthesis enzyme family protein [Endozoicomonas numazuensis]|uniref:Octaprenyl diphosphate synthase n=1 Tax=Endozoicomonas numazuensis TaxID=1137799 RepID=A0A081NMY6_9GAMM|nr:hypothetical protein [Endozoicomonas numazuensis]KEQ19809.1 hypothetical protein GZ78_08105 [Endozoicomonas numazuensis]
MIFTLSEGNPEQKILVREAIEEGGLDKIDQIVEAVRACGALNYTSQKVREQSEKSIASLQALPDRAYRDAMIDLARFAVARTF